MATTKYEVPAIVSMATTEMNSLANNDAALGVEYDNATGLYFWGDFELVVDPAAAPAADAPIELYLIPAMDGTNYSDGDGTPIAPASSYAGTFFAGAVATTQRIPLFGVRIPPCKFKALVYNKSGQAFESTGNVLRMLPSRTQTA
jgi:hypothetical protein